ncbi:MAG: type II toxin-antitoxin system VapC family toxin [Actinomycetes bacterium]
MTNSGITIVVDASTVVMLLADATGVGKWVASNLTDRQVAVPSLMPYEAANALRRRVLAGALDATTARTAHDDLRDLQWDVWPHSRLAERTWELRGAVSYYDASYIALAELLDAPLLTLDRRLTRAPGPRCAFLTPPQ